MFTSTNSSFHQSFLSTSTVADSYRQINVTYGNKTVLEEGYYYLNNFNNILSSFGNVFGFLKNKPEHIQCFFLSTTPMTTPKQKISAVQALTFLENNSSHVHGSEGTSQFLTVDYFIFFPVTLFELTVVNNWYITMVR